MNPSRTIALAAAAAALAIAGCGDSSKPSAPASTPRPSTPAATAAAAPASSPTASTSAARPQSTTVPSVPTGKADKPSHRNLPRQVRRRDVEDLARRFTRAWVTLELGGGDPDARRELAATITPQFAGELRQMQLTPREDPAELKGVDVIQHPGGKRWTAVVRLMRHGATEYLQPQIARRNGRLIVTGLSW